MFSPSYHSICCAGGQRNPIKPSHLVNTFSGPVYHSSELPSYLPVKGKRVGVLGTGSSSIQIVPALVNATGGQGGADGNNQPKELHVFQRSPGWILELPRGEFSPSVRWCFNFVPFSLFIYRLIIHFYVSEWVSSK